MRIIQEAESVHPRAIVIVAVCTVAVTALGVVIAWQLLEATRKPIPAAADFQAKRWGRPPAEVNALEMAPFPSPRGVSARERLPEADTPAATRSDGYSWSDRERGMVRIPIQRAKDLYLAGHRAAGAPPSGQGGPQR